MNKLIFLAGPSASGKSSLAIDIAKKLNLNIISADSLLVYKYFNIGTAKPSKEEQKILPHYMIDIVEPNYNYTVKEYKNEVFKLTQDLNKKKEKYIFVGGTGFYINAIINDTFNAPTGNLKIKNKLQKEAKENGNEGLYNKLKKIDPESCKRIHINDTYRIIRALEVYYISNKTMTHYRNEHKKKESKNSKIIVLNPSKEDLIENIKIRTNEMIKKGLVEEVMSLIKKGYAETKPMKSIGYKEVKEYIENKVEKKEMIENINKETKLLAKRQLTWFKKQKNTVWINTKKDYNKVKEIIQKEVLNA
jgi:tRNA dimethylallyltransferase